MGLTNKPKNYFHLKTEEQKNQYVFDLKALEIFFKKELDLDIYLAYGTLLGAIREHDFIAHDTDIDLFYLSKCNNKSDVYNERAALRTTLYAYKMLKNFTTIGLKTRYNESVFDIWTSWIDINNQFWCIPFENLCSAEDVIPFAKEKLRTEEFFVPKNSIKILDKIYITWNVPIHKNNKYLKLNNG